MGTRSLTVLQDHDGKEIAVLYRQMDGYLSGHGKELAKFLAPRRVVNGISGDAGAVFNGAHGLAAQVVAHFADAEIAGNFYLHAAGTRDCGEEYTYIIRPAGIPSMTAVGAIPVRVQAYAGEKLLFAGTAAEFLQAIPKLEEP